MELRALILSLLLLTLISSSESRSLDSPVQCATTCIEPSGVFQEDYTYVYKYDAEVASKFHTDTNDVSQMRMQAMVNIHAVSACELVLTVTDAELDGGHADWAASISRNPVHVNWQNGQIPNICAHNDDPTWVLNIKRGMLSALQVSTLETAKTVKETDVHGMCETSYANDNGVITKVKNFDSCEGREEFMLFTYFTPYNSDSPRQNFIASEQECDIVVGDDNLVRSSLCKESHVFRPFSNNESGAKTEMRQNLQYRRKYSNYRLTSLTVGNSNSKSLVFENEETSTSLSTDITDVRNLFIQTCNTLDTEDYEEVAKYFIKLVFLLRRIDDSAITQVYNMLDGVCPRHEASLKKMFENALPWCGSESCVLFSAELISNAPNSISNTVAKQWLTGISLISKPTMNTLSAVKRIVLSGKFKEQAYLTAGTVLHRVCQSASKNCVMHPEIRNFLNVFEEKLGTNCRTTSEDQKQAILLSLRAIGNAGRTNDVNVLRSCASEENNDMETRIAAIQAFRRMPCNADRSGLEKILFNLVEDSEARIASYISLMKCPKPKLIEQLVILLNQNDEILQVNSFIWSHLQQTLESKDPLKHFLKPILQETAFTKPHNLDPRKYSKYYEASVFSDTLNTGATVESSVVWSPKSFVPRSADLGLSVNLFGQAVNLLEIGGRVEGVEKMIQKMMQSDGFKNNPLGQFFKPDADDEVDDEEEEEEIIRPRIARSVDKSLLKRKQDQYSENLNTENQPNGNMYMRVFGNEMFYENARTFNAKKEEIDLPSIFTRLARDGKYRYHDDTMLINSAHVLPTGLGLPLQIAFNGSASVDVDMNGHMDLKGMFNSPPSLKVGGKIEPRAVVYLTGSMIVDGRAARSGISTKTSSTTSWTVQGSATISRGREFAVELGTPYQRNTFFSFEHKLLKWNGERMVQLTDSVPELEESCSKVQAGQRFCVHKPETMEVFPVSGATTVDAYLEKMDIFEKYTMTGSLDYELENGKMMPRAFEVEAIMDTPNSLTDFRTTLVARYSFDDMEFSASLRTPEVERSITGSIESEPNQWNFLLDYSKDDQTTRLRIGTHRVQEGDGKTWVATSTFTNENKVITGTAAFKLEPYKNIKANLTIDNLFRAPIVWNVSLNDNSQQDSRQIAYEGGARLTIPDWIDTGARFNMKFHPRLDNFNFKLTYSFDNEEEQTILFQHKRRNESTSRVTKWSADQKFVMSQYKAFNHQVKIMYANDETSVSSFVRFDYGRHASHQRNTKYILLNESLSFTKTNARTELRGYAQLDIQPYDMVYNGQLHHVHTNEQLETSLNVNHYNMSLLVQDNSEEIGHFSRRATLEVPTPWGRVRMSSNLEKRQDHVYTLNGEFALGSAQGLELSGSCELVNQATRKSITVDIGQDDNSILSARSSFVVQSQMGFDFQNRFQSMFTNLMELNASYTVNSRTASTATFVFSHNPTTYYSLTAMSETTRSKSTRSIRAEFKDSAAVHRHLELKGVKWINEETTNMTASLLTNMQLFSFEQASVSVQSSANDVKKYGSFLFTKDHEEMIGVDGNLSNNAFQIERNDPVSATLNLRQRWFELIPKSLTIGTDVNWQDDGSSFNVEVQRDEQLLLSLSVTLNDERTRASADLVHNFMDIPIPRSVSVLFELSPTQRRMTLNYDKPTRKEIQLTLTKESESRATFTFSNNDDDLKVPSSVEGSVEYGTRPSDSKKGVWFQAVIDGRNLNAELMSKVSETSMGLNFQFLHEFEAIPTINATLSFIKTSEMKTALALVNVNNSPHLMANLVSSNDKHAIKFIQSNDFLSRYLPRVITISLSQEVDGLQDINKVLELQVDDQSLTVTFSKAPDMVVLNLDSNFPYVNGRYSMSYRRASLLCKIEVSKNDQKFLVIVDRTKGVNVTVSQDIFERILPQKLNAFVTKSDVNVNLGAQYNKNRFSVTMSSDGATSKIHFSSKGSFFKKFGAPKTIDLNLVVPNSNEGTVTVLVKSKQYMLNCVSSLRLNEKQFSLSVSHDIDPLAEIGVGKSIDLNASLTHAFEQENNMIKARAGVLYNNVDYSVYFNISTKMNEDRPMEMDVTLGHTIMTIYDYGVPLEVRLHNVLNYDLLYGSGHLDTKVFRVYFNDNNERITQQNSVDFTVELGLVQGLQLTLSLAHNFSMSDFPRLLKLESSMDLGPRSSSYNDRKSLKIALTRDEVQETAMFLYDLHQLNEESPSLTFGIRQNVTLLCNYDVPKKVQLTFTKTSIDIVYDLVHKNAKFEYDLRDAKRLTVLFSHNFDILEQTLKIPKTIGGKIRFSHESDMIELEVEPRYNEEKYVAHFTTRFSPGRYRYMHHQNMVSDNYFPTRLRAEIEMQRNEHRMVLTMNGLRANVEIFSSSMSFDIKNQGFSFIPTRRIKASIEKEGNNGVVIILRKDEQHARVTVTREYDIELWTASVNALMTQTFIEDFPEVAFYANTSVGLAGSAYFNLQGISRIPYKIGLKYGLELSEKKVTVDFTHNQHDWRPTVPKDLEIVARYLNENNMHFVNIDVERERKMDSMRFSADYSIDTPWFAIVQLNHTFDEFVYLPVKNRIDLLFESLSQSIVMHANATFGEKTYIHTFDAMYNKQASSISLSAEAVLKNDFLNYLGVPHHLSGSLSAEWESMITAVLTTKYGENDATFSFETDKEEQITFAVQQTWTVRFRNVRVTVNKQENNRAVMEIELDGVRQEINVQGNWNENQAAISVNHSFEDTGFPNSIELQSSYRFSPDYFISLDTTIDEQEHHVEGRFEKLENGFHVSTNILGVPSSATLQNAIIPGGFSLELDHSIPSLIEYNIPRSSAINANIRTEPKLNVTGSIRLEDNTQKISFEVDNKLLRFAFKHSFAILPLPSAIEVELGHSNSPASIDIKVTVNGIVRSASASVDREALQASVSHTIPELDQWFAARSVVVGLKKHTEALGGEFYVSIDGLERRVGGSFFERTLNIFSTFEYVPRNITLKVEGTMQPLNGQVILFIDGTERSIGAEVNVGTQDFSAAFSLNAPETESIIPSRSTVSGSYNKTGAQMDLSFYVNNKNKILKASVNVEESIAFRFSHDVDYLRDSVPELIIFIGKFASNPILIDLFVGHEEYSFEGKLLNGQDDRWYGVEAHLQHSSSLLAAYNVLDTASLVLKGKKTKMSIEAAVLAHLVEGYMYQGNAKVEMKKKRKSLLAEYEHTFNNSEKALSVALSATNKKLVYKLRLDASQTKPERKEFNAQTTFDLANDNMIQYSLTLNQNAFADIPRDVTIPQATLTWLPDSSEARWEVSASIDDEISSSSGSVSFHLERGQSFIVNAQAVVQHKELHKTLHFSTNAHRNPDHNEVSVNYMLNIIDVNTNRQNQDDNITIILNMQPNHPFIAALVKQDYLNNNLGIPRLSEISADLTNNGPLNKHWEFHFKIGDIDYTSVVDFNVRKDPFYLNIGSSLDGTESEISPQWVKLLPTHALAYLTIDCQSKQPLNVNSSLKLEYENQKLRYDSSMQRSETSGSSDEVLTIQNIPRLEKWLGASIMKRSYNYHVTNDNILQARGQIQKDGVVVVTYTFYMNLATKAFSYASQYDENAFVVIYDVQNTQTFKNVTFRISENGTVLVNFNLAYSTSKFDFQLKNNIREPVFDVQITAVKNNNKISANTTVNAEQSHYSGNFTVTPSIKEGNEGQTIRYIEVFNGATFDTSIQYAFSDDYTSGNINVTTSYKDFSVSLSYTPKTLDFIVDCDKKHVEFHYNDKSTEDSMSYKLTLGFGPHKLRRKFSLPASLSASMRLTSSRVKALVTADKTKLVDLDASFWKYSLAVRSFDGDQSLNTNGWFESRSNKVVHVDFVSDLFNKRIDLQFNGELEFLKKKTGNSSLNVTLVDAINTKNLSLYLTVNPAENYDAEDFVASLSANSTFETVPFKIHVLCKSNKESSMYNGTIAATYNDQKILLDLRTAPTNSTLQIIQAWCSYSPLTINWSKHSSNGFKTTQMKLQWSEDPLDSFSIITKMKNLGIISYSVQAAQPSGVFYVSSAAGSVSFDMTSPDTYLFNAQSNLNSYQLGLNVNYTGDLPQVFGAHSLVVDITQPIFSIIPTQFKTDGQLFISPTQYTSSWSIKSNEKELAVLKKTLSWTDNMSMNVYWKQSYFNTKFHFVKLIAAGSDGGMSGSASLQVDDMPRMSGSYQLMMPSDSVNRSLSIDLTSGALSRYLPFRTLSFAAWNSAEERRATTKQWSVSLDVDRRPNKFYLKQINASGSNGKNSVATTIIKIDHSFDLEMFGRPLPQSISMQAKSLLTENQNRKYVASYSDNLLLKDYKLSFEYKNRINPFDLTIFADEEQLFKAEIFVKEESLSLSINYPEKHLNAEIVLKTKNNDEIMSFNVTAKNYTTAPLFERYELSFSFDKNQHIVVLAWNYPQINRTELRGDLSQVISQAKRMFQTMMSEATSSSLSFVKGITPTRTGYDMYVGFEKERGATYTLHLLVGTNNGGYFAAVQTKKNFEVQSDVFRASAKIIDHRLAKLQLSANPTLIKFIQTLTLEFNSEAAHKINRLSDLLVEGLESLKTVAVGNEGIETVVNARVDELIGQVNMLRNQLIRLVAALASGTEHNFSQASFATEEGVRKSITMLLNMVDKLKAIILRPFTDVYDEYMGSIMRKINNALIDTLQPITVIVEKFHAGQLFIELVIEAVEKMKNYVMTNGESCFTMMRAPLSDFLYVDGNNVIFALPLAVEVEELKPLPSIEDLKTWLARSALAITINENLEKLYSYADEYYKARALLYIPRDELLPPFKGHAFVSGFRHFSTFDKKYYDFSSGCATSHLLVSDMRGDNFTVAVSYAGDANTENSIEVIVGGNRVTLYNDYVVRVNRRVKQLPVYLDTMSVMLQGNVIHVRKNEGDLDVACDFTKQLCSVEVSPFYFGATAGLAGIYNNEPLDDFTKPDHNIADSVTEFTDSWTISTPQCSTNTYRPCASNKRPTRCAALFKKTDSPLRPCFPLVDPKPFMKMCADDLCDAQNTKKVCQAAHAYAHECNLKGARVQLPDECVECVTLRNDQFYANTTKHLAVRSADVVLVLERGSCMRNIAKSMKQFIRKWIPNIGGAGLSDIHYHLVGYGGDGANVHPSTYTFSGSGYTTQKNAFHRAIRDMDISREQSQADTLRAILYASQLPFRAGAKPIIISVSCDLCMKSEVSYSQVERQIRKQGIILHHVPVHEITAGRKSMFGFDSVNAFSGGRPVGHAVVQPNKQDMCEPLATVTGGSVWNGVLMMKSNKSFHLKFTEYIVSEIRQSERLHCTCEMNEMGVPTSVCR